MGTDAGKDWGQEEKGTTEDEPLPTTGLLDSDSCPPSSPTEARSIYNTVMKVRGMGSHGGGPAEHPQMVRQ